MYKESKFLIVIKMVKAKDFSTVPFTVIKKQILIAFIPKKSVAIKSLETGLLLFYCFLLSHGVSFVTNKGNSVQ